MIQSMTGFGNAELVSEDFAIKSEIRSLNSKYFDCQIKIPKELSAREIEIRKIIEGALERGKITAIVEITFKNGRESLQIINEELFKQYYLKLKNLAREVGAGEPEIFKVAVFMPDVLNVSALNEKIVASWNDIENVLTSALQKCLDFRNMEGKKLEMELLEYLSNISVNLKKAESLDPERLESVKLKIKKNIRDLIPRESFDENRFEQELLYYIEKLDISEEKVRLNAHIDYFKEVVGSAEGNGKKLSFIAQEIGREINTIGSKANWAPIQRYVVLMKDELEKIKEQLLNIL